MKRRKGELEPIRPITGEEDQIIIPSLTPNVAFTCKLSDFTEYLDVQPGKQKPIGFTIQTNGAREMLKVRKIMYQTDSGTSNFTEESIFEIQNRRRIQENRIQNDPRIHSFELLEEEFSELNSDDFDFYQEETEFVYFDSEQLETFQRIANKLAGTSDGPWEKTIIITGYLADVGRIIKPVEEGDEVIIPPSFSLKMELEVKRPGEIDPDKSDPAPIPGIALGHPCPPKWFPEGTFTIINDLNPGFDYAETFKAFQKVTSVVKPHQK